MGDRPLVFAAEADKMPLVHLILTSMNSQRPAVDQAVRRLAAGGFQDITESLAGDAHFFRGFFMIQAFEVSQAERLELVQCEVDLFESQNRDSRRFEVSGGRMMIDPPADHRPGH